MTPIIFIIGIMTMFSMAVVLLKIVSINQQNWDGRTRGSQTHEFNNFMKRTKLYSSKMKRTHIA
ncbi:hypothetical protein [Emticicia sp. TH156]|uniref:hypothetical protein n=1 Tax=Emticicia sp. TH156 TaxID=2067454 RepID=UPI000C77542A|nr:hypothetical protein [Emticicia sp. TH156]PLK42211.1 hypothetical protein C0V77_22120 [Emticicia sp. TH156]